MYPIIGTHQHTFNLPLREVGALAFIHDDLYLSVRNDDDHSNLTSLDTDDHSQYHTKWVRIGVENSPEYCEYCGSGWTESKFHPGTCGNCGAGALFAQRTNNVN